MGRVSSIKTQISLRTIQRRILKTTGITKIKWKIIYYAKKEPRPAKEIADLVEKWKEQRLANEFTDYEKSIIKKLKRANKILDHITATTAVVQKTIAAFNKYGESSITKIEKKIRNNAYLSYKEEKEFLRSFVKEYKYRYKRLTNLDNLHAAYEKRIGHNVDKSTIYRILKRHHWKKIRSDTISYWIWYRGSYPYSEYEE